MLVLRVLLKVVRGDARLCRVLGITCHIEEYLGIVLKTVL